MWPVAVTFFLLRTGTFKEAAVLIDCVGTPDGKTFGRWNKRRRQGRVKIKLVVIIDLKSAFDMFVNS